MSSTENNKDSHLSLAGYSARVLVTFMIAVVAAGIWLIRDTLLIVFTAVLIAIILKALARRIQRFSGLGTQWSLTAATLTTFLLTGLLFYMFGQEFMVQLSELGERLPNALNRLRAMIKDSGYEVQLTKQLGRSMPDGSTLFGIAQNILAGVSGAVTGLVLALMGGIFLAVQPDLYIRGVAMLAPKSKSDQVTHALSTTNTSLKQWLKGQMVSMLFTGVTITVGLMLIAVPSPLALGLVAGLLGFIPMIGPLIGAAFGVLVALSVNMHAFWLTVLLYFVVQQIAGNIIEPLMMQRTVNVPPALTLFSLLAIGTLFGAVGVLLGGPLLVAAFVLTRELYVKNTLGHELKDKKS